MAETEVESILREIRERVLSQQHTSEDLSRTTAHAATNGGNGASDAFEGMQDSETLTAETLALINSYLTTTARAWDRLPPLVSYRSGLAARLELWIKQRLRTATRWFTWEQVNFNAAVHHALRDLLPVLSAYEQALRILRAGVDAESEARRVDFERHRAEITAERAELRTELRTELRVEITDIRAEMTGIHAELREEIAGIRAEIEGQRTATESQRAEINARLTEQVSEVRERDERLQDEQRVCFKQLALQTSEAAVLEDRARRKTETLLEELTRRLAELEKR
jgi:hypothetical protein